MNHGPNAVLGIAALVILAIILAIAPSKKTAPPPPEAFEVPVPLQEATTAADAGAMAWRVVPGTLPVPDTRQLKAEGCRKALGQYVINGVCWQQLPVPPPCPRSDGAFEHDDHRCYVPVLRAERAPQSGEPRPRGVAEP